MTERGALVALEGASAAGKTTLVRAAARRLGWYALAEAFDRLDPAPSLEYASPHELLRLEETLLAEETRRYREARRLCARGRTVLADTGFLGPVTYTRGLLELGRAPATVVRTLERTARSLLHRRALGIPDLTVYLTSTSRERTRRARADRAGHPATLASRHEAVGEAERRYFDELFPDALPERFRTLAGGLDTVSRVAGLRRFVEEAPSTPASRAEALVILSVLRPPARKARRRFDSPNR